MTPTVPNVAFVLEQHVGHGPDYVAPVAVLKHAINVRTVRARVRTRVFECFDAGADLRRVLDIALKAIPRRS